MVIRTSIQQSRVSSSNFDFQKQPEMATFANRFYPLIDG